VPDVYTPMRQVSGTSDAAARQQQLSALLVSIRIHASPTSEATFRAYIFEWNLTVIRVRLQRISFSWARHAARTEDRLSRSEPEL
jgi:hypothetical protein